MSIESKDSPLLHDGLSLFVDLFFICSAEEVVHGNIVEIRDFDEDLSGNVAGSGFVVTVCTLRTMQIICHLLLGKIFVLTQVSDSYILHKFLPLQYTYSTKILQLY